jgi:hypothetical protein
MSDLRRDKVLREAIPIAMGHYEQSPARGATDENIANVIRVRVIGIGRMRDS